MDRREEAHLLAAGLTAALGVETVWVTAERSKARRVALAERMRSGGLRWAVATSAWSTGIDIPGLKTVVLMGRNKAPIGVLQSSGRATRPDGSKPEYEILNLVEDGLEAQALERARVLASGGFKSADEEFLSELEQRVNTRRPGGRGTQPAISWVDTFFCIFGPRWAWGIALVVIVVRMIAYAAAGSEP